MRSDMPLQSRTVARQIQSLPDEFILPAAIAAPYRNTCSLLKLDREIVAPVNVMAQGVLIASGEVVVIDDRYAIRITSIFGPKNQAAFGSQGT